MKSISLGKRTWLLGLLGMLCVTGFSACNKKTDPAAASSGGGASGKRVVLTFKGAAR